MSFTPLVSPAVTPLDPHFNVDNAFSLPPTYFSPLTSPALHAQTDHNAFFNQHLQQGVINTSSPVEMDLEANHNTPQEVAKKARKSSTSKAVRKPNVRQSPIAKPQRRKTASSFIVKQVLNEAVESSSAKSRTNSPNDMAGTRRDETDENDSVSPEALSEMPPPPLPPPKTSRGNQVANGNQQQSAAPKPAPLPLGAMPSPATPASLMKLPSSSPSSSASSSTAHKATASPNHLGQHAPPEHVTMFQLPASVTSLPDEHLSPHSVPAQSHPMI
ncbi:MAG: hypothetical protein IMZ46_01045, partial [Acidobacteria bacterium]|nr:hypothetical protein [Acidobacteriota bacterium]